MLLVWGAHDRMLPHSDARMAFDALPTTQVELIEGCGHQPQLEATGRLAELLLPFGTINCNAPAPARLFRHAPAPAC